MVDCRRLIRHTPRRYLRLSAAATYATMPPRYADHADDAAVTLASAAASAADMLCDARMLLRAARICARAYARCGAPYAQAVPYAFCRKVVFAA